METNAIQIQTNCPPAEGVGLLGNLSISLGQQNVSPFIANGPFRETNEDDGICILYIVYLL